MIKYLWTWLHLFTDCNVMFQRTWNAFLHNLSVRSLLAFILEKGDRERRPYHSLQLPEGSCSEEHVSLFCQVTSDRRGENGLKLHLEKFALEKLLNSKVHTLHRSTYIIVRSQMSRCVIIQLPVSYLSTGLQKCFHLNLGVEMWKHGPPQENGQYRRDSYLVKWSTVKSYLFLFRIYKAIWKFLKVQSYLKIIAM